MYVKQFNNNERVILCLYVDEILIFGSNMQFINDVESFLSRNFDMKSLGCVFFFFLCTAKILIKELILKNYIMNYIKDILKIMV